MLNKVQLNPLPNVRPWFRGLINLRGSLVSVFDLLIAFQEGDRYQETALIRYRQGRQGRRPLD